ncbi:MAG: MFS transporter [Chloroflexota bacterium]
MVKSKIPGKEEHPLNEVGTPPYQMRYRWVMLALVWLSYFIFGLISHSLAPLITPILKDLNISYSLMGIILGSWPLSFLAFSAIAGAIIDRWGISKSLFAGLIIVGLSESLRYFANGFTTLLICVALYGVGSPLIAISAPKMVSLWFQERGRGIAVGIYMTGPWVGGLVAYSTANSIIMPLTGYSWRLTFVCFGLLAFVTAVLCWFLAKDTRPTEATGSTKILQLFGSLIRIWNIRIILIMGLFLFAIGHGFSDWLPKILEASGLPPTIAGFAASIPLLFSIPALLTIPRLVTPRLRGRIVAIISLAVAIILLMVVMGSGATLVAGLVLYGLSFCSIMPLLILILMDTPEIGSRYMGSATGLFLAVAEIGGFAGPFIVGAIKDLTGDFLIGAIFLAGAALALSIMALFLKSKPATDVKDVS